MRRILTGLTVVAAVMLIASFARAAGQFSGGPPPWWHGRTAGLVGGIVGSVIGVFGGILGTLCGMGKARRFVLAWMRVLIVLGILSVVAGLVAVALSQPYAVYYPLLLCGVILIFVLGVNLPVARRRFEEIELRKMDSMDAS